MTTPAIDWGKINSYDRKEVIILREILICQDKLLMCYSLNKQPKERYLNRLCFLRKRLKELQESL